MPYPDEHPARAWMTDLQNYIENTILESSVLGKLEDPGHAVEKLIEAVSHLSVIVVDLMDQVEWDPSRIRRDRWQD